MGRTIVADERVQKCIEGLKIKESWVIGLLIGQITDQRDYVVHMVQTPDDTEPETADGKEAKKGGLDTVDDGWVTTHARQVLRMLPGGLDIVGIFVIVTQDAMKNAHLALRKVLFAIQKMINKTEATTIHGDRVILNICPLSKKVTCRTFDTTDIKSAARPAEWKVQSVLSSWVTADSSLTIDHTILVSQQALSNTLNKQIQAGLVPLVSNVKSALATVDGQLRAGSEPVKNNIPVAATSQSKKSKKSPKEVKDAINVKVDLLLSMRSATTQQTTVVKTDCGAQMRLCGTISSRAFVHAKATVEETVQAVKKDLVRSLVARCDLLCEDLLQAEEEQDPRVLYETPVRIHGTIPDSVLCFSDYMFQDETHNDSIDRFKELLNLDLTEDNLQMDIEHVPTEADVSQADESLGDAAESFIETSTKNKAINLIGAAVGAAVAMLAAGISYMYIGD